MPQNIDTQTDISSIIKSLDESFIITILKYFSNEEHPLSASEIAFRMSTITDEEYNIKTILRKTRNICTLLEDGDERCCDAFVLTYGGYVYYTASTGSEIKKPQFKFYFEPILMPSDITMLHGAISSNRYIRPSEENYLHNTLKLLAPDTLTPNKDEDAELPKLPARSSFEKKSPKYMDLLSTVKTLYDAIKSKQQIELVFGHYTMDANKYRQITFQSKNEENPYILNPYALFWNNGNCYLLATHKGHDNPAYFRVDRIVNVRLCQSPNPEDCMRAPIPEDLKQYFTVTADEDEIFNAELYTSMHPFLSIAQNENLVECFLECRQDALSLIVDTFGLTDVSERQIQVLKSNIVHEDELDQNGSPINYITVRIPNVQYESIKSFCINYHQFVTLLSPPLLVIEVFLAIIKSALRYSKVIPPLFTGKDDEVNPFISIGDTLLSALNKLQQ